MTASARGNAKEIRVVAIKEADGTWSAQCLEYDIGAQAADLETLHRRIVLAIGAERAESIRRNGKPFAGIGPAPTHFHALWEQAPGNYTPRAEVLPEDDGYVETKIALRA